MTAAPARDLARMTWPEVAALDKRDGAVVLPLGSIEQHGPHLAADCDGFFAARFLELAVAALGDDVPLWLLPMIPIGKSNEHQGFPGSFWLSARTFLAVLDDVADGVAASGFRRLVLWNCHGGNRAILDVAARDIRARTGLMVFTLFPPAMAADPVAVTEAEAAYGIHAGDWETSVMLALDPGRVRADRRDAAFPAFAGRDLSLEFGGANVAWLTADFMASGTWGDATVASEERGRARVEAVVPVLARVLAEIARFEMPAAAGGASTTMEGGRA